MFDGMFDGTFDGMFDGTFDGTFDGMVRRGAHDVWLLGHNREYSHIAARMQPRLSQKECWRFKECWHKAWGWGKSLVARHTASNIVLTPNQPTINDAFDDDYKRCLRRRL